MSGRCVDVLKRVKSLIGRYRDVIQSWVVGCDVRPGSFPTFADYAHAHLTTFQRRDTTS